MKILVAAASKHGATAQIADAIGEHLRAAGHVVDVRAPDTVDDLDRIDAVVLGSAVYAGHWLKAARGLGPGPRRPAARHPHLREKVE